MKKTLFVEEQLRNPKVPEAGAPIEEHCREHRRSDAAVTLTQSAPMRPSKPETVPRGLSKTIKRLRQKSVEVTNSAFRLRAAA